MTEPEPSPEIVAKLRDMLLEDVLTVVRQVTAPEVAARFEAKLRVRIAE